MWPRCRRCSGSRRPISVDRADGTADVARLGQVSETPAHSGGGPYFVPHRRGTDALAHPARRYDVCSCPCPQSLRSGRRDPDDLGTSSDGLSRPDRSAGSPSMVLPLGMPGRFVPGRDRPSRPSAGTPNWSLSATRSMDRSADAGRRVPGVSVPVVARPIGPVRRPVRSRGLRTEAWRNSLNDRLPCHVDDQSPVAWRMVRPGVSTGGFPGSVVPRAQVLSFAGAEESCRGPIAEADASGRCGGSDVRGRHATASPQDVTASPPGAVDDSAFTGLCTRCGNCARVCPSGIIERDLGAGGWAGLLTPVLSFHRDYCREDCVRCAQACPTGALSRVSLAKKRTIRLGLPRVDMSLCLLGEDRECSLCRSRCPYEAIRYVFSEADYTLTPQIDPNRCNGCGACEAACPTSPRKAIVVLPI